MLWVLVSINACFLRNVHSLTTFSTHGGGRYLVELNPSVFVMDCLPNMNAETVNSRAPAVLKQLRDGLGPDVPIVVLEGHTCVTPFYLFTFFFSICDCWT